MIRWRMAFALTCSFLIASSFSLEADVRADRRNHVEFAGVLGKMMNLFGGKAAREGVVSSVAVKGDRKATLNEATGQIVDLGEEKIYDLDVKKKTYKVTTFAELRRQMEEAQRKAQENARREQAREQPKEEKKAEPAQDKNQKEYEVDFDLKDTHQKKAINGFDTHEVMMTITVREKGKTLEQAGGMVLTSDMWLAPNVPAMKEIMDFDVRYAQKLAGPMVAGASADQMAAAMAMYPHMKDGLARMNKENVKMDGMPIQTIVKMDAVKSADQVEQEQKQSAQEDTKSKPPTSVGGMLGGFMAKKVAPKKAEDEPKDRVTFMTMTDEVLKVTTSVGAADVAIPAGFQQK